MILYKPIAIQINGSVPRVIDRKVMVSKNKEPIYHSQPTVERQLIESLYNDNTIDDTCWSVSLGTTCGNIIKEYEFLHCRQFWRINNNPLIQIDRIILDPKPILLDIIVQIHNSALKPNENDVIVDFQKYKRTYRSTVLEKAMLYIEESLSDLPERLSLINQLLR